MTPHDALVRTALRIYRRIPSGYTRDDLRQEAWLALLAAEPRYDPARHRCTREAFLVRAVRKHVSRLCARAAAHPTAPLDSQTPARDLPAADEAALKEAICRARNCSSPAPDGSQPSDASGC